MHLPERFSSLASNTWAQRQVYIKKWNLEQHTEKLTAKHYMHIGLEAAGGMDLQGMWRGVLVLCQKHQLKIILSIINT